jgi:hypothetical protein
MLYVTHSFYDIHSIHLSLHFNVRVYRRCESYDTAEVPVSVAFQLRLEVTVLRDLSPCSPVEVSICFGVKNCHRFHGRKFTNQETNKQVGKESLISSPLLAELILYQEDGGNIFPRN